MNTATETTSPELDQEVECVTFYVGDILIGVDIHQVEEINRHVEVTEVPRAPRYVRGVINLRGEVVTVIDPRVILNLPPVEITKQTRTVVVSFQGEQIGLLIDRIADVIRCRSDEIDPAPANADGADGRFFEGVYQLDTELLVILNVEAALALKEDAGQAGTR